MVLMTLMMHREYVLSVIFVSHVSRKLHSDYFLHVLGESEGVCVCVQSLMSEKQIKRRPFINILFPAGCV